MVKLDPFARRDVDKRELVAVDDRDEPRRLERWYDFACTGEVQDTVLYGDPVDPIEDLELDDDQGLSSMATMPESNMSVGRTDDGVDTDDNAADFTTNMPPTPGESNAVRDLAAGSGKGCGCGGKSESPDGTDGPMEAGGLAGLLVSFAMFIAMRRRDD